MTTTVREVAALIHALSPQERYRLAGVLFERNEPASTQLAHAIVAQAVADDVIEPEQIQ